MSNKKTGELMGKEQEGVNQILPHMHKDFWDLYRKGKNNNWNPEDVAMQIDKNNWDSGKLTDDEKRVVKRCLRA